MNKAWNAIAACVIGPAAVNSAVLNATNFSYDFGISYKVQEDVGPNSQPNGIVVFEASHAARIPLVFTHGNITATEYKLTVGQVCVTTTNLKSFLLFGMTDNTSYCRSITDGDLSDISKAFIGAGRPAKGLPVKYVPLSSGKLGNGS